jgi:hypothetical protein
MNIQKKLRHIQDNYRNAGWRIQWIPWWEPEKPEVIRPKNPLPLIGVALFLGAIFWGQRPIFGISLSVYQTIAVLIAGLAIIMLGVIISAFQNQFGWIRINAFCIDREIREYSREPGDLTSTWGYRLLCVFNYEGQEYKVTPEASHLTGFNSERQVQKYLNERIGHDGYCQLWIDPDNPLHTIFHKKKWWL